MDLNPVILAIPMYFTLMTIELVYESITKRKTYRLNDSITNINTGVLQQLTGTFNYIFKVGVYALVYEYFAFAQIPENGWTFLIALTLWDLCYYWEHRMAHSISLLWGGHVVHHQSEQYNLSVALRQTSTGFLWSIPFYLPMALLGFSPTQFLFVGGINLLYQFWIHTEHIDKLPRWFEYIFNTPSHHRVHHGRDPKYIDKNYAGIWIVWDRMFGTFKEEEERPNYGITTPLQSWNPVYANFAHYIDLFQTVKKVKNVGDGMKVLFNKPGWMPDYLGGHQTPKEVPPSYQKYDTQNATKINLYILSQFVIALLFNALYFFKNTDFSNEIKIGFAVWIVLSTLMFGFLFETKSKWLPIFEVVRLSSIPIGLYFIQLSGFVLPSWVLLVAVGIALSSLLAFSAIYRLASKPTIITAG